MVTGTLRDGTKASAPARVRRAQVLSLSLLVASVCHGARTRSRLFSFQSMHGRSSSAWNLKPADKLPFPTWLALARVVVVG